MIRVCEHCWSEISGLWVSDIPLPGQRPGDVPYWHLDRYECRVAAFSAMAAPRDDRNREEG